MSEYIVDVWGTRPTPENFQHIEADNEQEAKHKAVKLSSVRMVTNVEVEEQ